MNEIKKYDYINALRGLAILAVILHHVSQWLPPSLSILKEIGESSSMGVQLFYIASSLTLFLSMTSRKKTEHHPYLNFFLRRFFRIAPMFYIAIIVYTLLFGLDEHHFSPSGIKWWHVLLTALFLHGWLPETINSVVPGGWSIAVEMTFYLTVPYLFLKLTSIKTTLWALFCSIIFAKLTSYFTVNLFYDDYPSYLLKSFVFFWLPSQAPIFLSGILAFHIIKLNPTDRYNLAGPLLCLSFLFFIGLMEIDTYKNILSQHFLYGLVFLLLTLSLHFSKHPFIVNKITTYIGNLSYSIYLTHLLIIELLKRFFVDFKLLFSLPDDLLLFIGFITTVILSCLLSQLTYRLIELPGIELGKRLINRIEYKKQLTTLVKI